MGKALAAELEPTDVLGRWMAHHIAELITAAEDTAAPATDPQAVAAAEAIGALWAHRAGSPYRRQPLASFDAVLRLLDEWTSPYTPWRFSRAYDQLNEAPTTAEVEQHHLLQVALAADEAMRKVVTTAIAAAAQQAADQEAPWLNAARLLGGENERQILRRLRQFQRTVWQEAQDPSDTGETLRAGEPSASSAHAPTEGDGVIVAANRASASIDDCPDAALAPGREEAIAHLTAALDEAIATLTGARQRLNGDDRSTDASDVRQRWRGRPVRRPGVPSPEDGAP